VIENCREQNGVHTCDKRNTRSYIERYKPAFAIEETLTELDELWSTDIRETKPQVAVRVKKVLDRIFDENAQEIFISVTAHGGWIDGFLTSIGRNIFPLPTGGVLPVLVKATKLDTNSCGSATHIS
jgi:broad specificity phosphatase PhoE